MNFIQLTFIILFFCEIVNLFELNEGDSCRTNNRLSGTCVDIRRCPWALIRLKSSLRPDICNFVGRIQIVCCPQSFTRINRKVKIDKKLRFGDISSAKCKQYYPNDVLFAYLGVPTLPQEFPHMAALGYRNENDIRWGCGGSLISLQHILTAAHCLYSRGGDVKYVRLGDMDLKNDTDDTEPQNFIVKETIDHPDYDRRTSKNDIAIITLDREIEGTSSVQPACLNVEFDLSQLSDITATGWGITEFGGEPSSHLMRVELKISEISECRKHYANVGIDEKRQICADSADSSLIMDTCEGDSGGPLQTRTYFQRYNILGVTSFGKPCGVSRIAGVYTRVSHYIPWIESVIWNDEIIFPE